ncbi:MAG TPA: cyclase family protein [Myxococcaceae bacterium]|jgi:kynurenine formamidase
MKQSPAVLKRLVRPMVLAGCLLASAASAYDPYPGPSRWGPGDEAGASNTQTPAKVLEAKWLIKSGKVYDLGHTYKPSMPMFPGNYGLSIDTKPEQHLARQIVNTEMLHGEFTQMGTQFDALGHFGILAPGSDALTDALFYNQFTGAQVIGPNGLKHLGVENVRPFVTRGILLDIKRYANGNQMMQPGQEVTLAMVRQTLAAQGMTEFDIREGDVVLFVTGWEAMWDAPNNGYYIHPELGLAAPGLGLEVARWLSSKKVACVGADNWGLEVSPPRPPATPEVLFPVHHQLLVKSGIYMHESLKLKALANDLAADHLDQIWDRTPYEFFYVYNPVSIKGGSGAPGAPLVIR